MVIFVHSICLMYLEIVQHFSLRIYILVLFQHEARILVDLNIFYFIYMKRDWAEHWFCNIVMYTVDFVGCFN